MFWKIVTKYAKTFKNVYLVTSDKESLKATFIITVLGISLLNPITFDYTPDNMAKRKCEVKYEDLVPEACIQGMDKWLQPSVRLDVITYPCP